MNYLIYGKNICINTMQKPSGGFGSIYEFSGDESLKEIGLNQKFYFRATYGFSNLLPVSCNQTEIKPPQNDFQTLLGTFLRRSIYNGHLTNQFEGPHHLEFYN